MLMNIFSFLELEFDETGILIGVSFFESGVSLKKGDPLEPAARSSRCSYLRLQRHSVNTPTTFIDQEKA